jgi:DNA-binding transcriptional LysR family regulator
MIIDNINLNNIRIFESVYRTQSMTLAAQELHLTQSGVSQHMKSLEEMLGVQLFDRIKQKLVPTAAGATLFKQCSKSLTEIEQALWQIKGGDKELSGTVAIGMPIEFGNNVLLPLLSKFCRKNARVKLKIKLDFASSMNEQLLRGDLDFAFVDDFKMDARVKIEKVYDEILELCTLESFVNTAAAAKNARKYFEGLQYVEYQEDEPLLRNWFAHHLDARNISLDVRATVMDVQGLARLILEGLGAGILPGHLFQKLTKEGHKLHRFKGCGRPLKNAISAAFLHERTHSPATLGVLNYLRESLTKTLPANSS